MNKPNALIKLLADLKAEDSGTSVVTVKNSHATVALPGQADDLSLSAAECELLFDTPETVVQFFEALDEPSGGCLDLHNISVEDDVMEALQGYFDVDES